MPPETGGGWGHSNRVKNRKTIVHADDLQYYQHVRAEIEPLLPAKATRILEIGCGAGQTLAWLKKRYPGATTFGIDQVSDLKDELVRNVDQVLMHDLDEPLPDIGQFDLVLALDVLEHLRWPERVLQSLENMMDENATLIVSLPNVSHVSVSLPLLFKRQFQYADFGILDRTHVRFFVETSAVELLNKGNFQVVGGLLNGLNGPKSRLLDNVTFGVLRPWLARQFIMKAHRTAGRPRQDKVVWKRGAR